MVPLSSLDWSGTLYVEETGLLKTCATQPGLLFFFLLNSSSMVKYQLPNEIIHQQKCP